MGSSDYDRDLTYYRDVLKAQQVWNFDRFGSRITAFSLCAGPLILVADHRTAPACQPVFRVADLSASARDLRQRGWQPSAGPFGTPNGEAYSFKDPSGNAFAIYQIDETSTDRAYYDPTEND
jgi:Glyoxalase/Bleomycin resistance protein/Dioxygenase superfamily.